MTVKDQVLARARLGGKKSTSQVQRLPKKNGKNKIFNTS